ncbi:CcdC family protein [Paenibacillus baekrokdamisoli]|nr:cytochrome c biogenesis protein CcdC [Paenibacillus baekrokdamisoli]
MQVIPIVLLVMALIIWRRTRAMTRAIKGNGIRMLLPMLFLLPAVLMFLNPELHMTTREIVLAIGTGILLSIPLILTTNYEIREDGQIYAKKSIGFIISFVGLVLFRLGLRNYLSGLDPNELTALFLLVAASYIIPWRLVSYIKFRKLIAFREIEAKPADNSLQ